MGRGPSAGHPAEADSEVRCIVRPGAHLCPLCWLDGVCDDSDSDSDGARTRPALSGVWFSRKIQSPVVGLGGLPPRQKPSTGVSASACDSHHLSQPRHLPLAQQNAASLLPAGSLLDAEPHTQRCGAMGERRSERPASSLCPSTGHGGVASLWLRQINSFRADGVSLPDWLSLSVLQV